jgi:agmatine deiminase
VAHKLRFPPEWARQSGVLLTWPHEYSDWQPWLAEVEPVFTRIAREVCRRERLLVACRDDAHRKRLRQLLRQAEVELERVTLHIAPSNDAWARDHGPVTVYRDSAPCLLDFSFNGWGGKYAAELDNALTRRLHAAGAFGGARMESVALVLEGGSIETDGLGTLLTTARCLLSPGRNPGLSAPELECRLKELLGLNRILWLQHGLLLGDDTDGHIDTLARFCDPVTLAYVSCNDPGDPHFAELAAMEQELEGMSTPQGKAYRLVPLPLPRGRYDEQARRLPATYANFLIINGAVLVPVYGDPADALATERLTDCFPGREIVPIDCLPLLRQYGSLHCVTMQLPEGVL